MQANTEQSADKKKKQPKTKTKNKTKKKLALVERTSKSKLTYF